MENVTFNFEPINASRGKQVCKSCGFDYTVTNHRQEFCDEGCLKAYYWLEGISGYIHNQSVLNEAFDAGVALDPEIRGVMNLNRQQHARSGKDNPSYKHGRYVGQYEVSHVSSPPRPSKRKKATARRGYNQCIADRCLEPVHAYGLCVRHRYNEKYSEVVKAAKAKRSIEKDVQNV